MHMFAPSLIPFEQKLQARFDLASMGATYTWETMKDKYDAWLKNLKVTRFQDAEMVASHLVQFIPAYDFISQASAVPISFLACVHYRESNNSFHTYFGNGDPLDRPTTHVPAGQGPFKSFADGCISSLHQMGLFGLASWTLDFFCYSCERFNGFGYEMHGHPSTYVFGGTNVQQRGKYESDGHWNAQMWDQQLGTMAIYQALIQKAPNLALPMVL
jgi:lysozyme family protein